MQAPPGSDSWQQEKAFLDYMFSSLGADALPEPNRRPAAAAGLSTPCDAPPQANGVSPEHGQQQQAAATSFVTAAASVTPAAVAGVGFDQLDNLCKLMQQLGELRDHNGRLQKRVQYLEDMKTLQEMHHDLQFFAARAAAAPTPDSASAAGVNAGVGPHAVLATPAAVRIGSLILFNFN